MRCNWKKRPATGCAWAVWWGTAGLRQDLSGAALLPCSSAARGAREGDSPVSVKGKTGGNSVSKLKVLFRRYSVRVQAFCLHFLHFQPHAGIA